MINYIDSHAHITSDAVFPEVDSLLKRAKAAGITDIVNICTDAVTLQRGLELAKKRLNLETAVQDDKVMQDFELESFPIGGDHSQSVKAPPIGSDSGSKDCVTLSPSTAVSRLNDYPAIHTVAATTPHDVAAEGEQLFPLMQLHARQGDLVAVGETGLDYFHHHSPPDKQKDFLRRYLHLALECHLPVVIHCREAFGDFFQILDAEYTINGKHAPGVLHCFTGTEAEAEEVIKRGWYLSLSGIVTFKKSDILRNVAKMVPLDRLLIETDTPYLAPQGHRGKTNEPAFLPETAAMIASCRGITHEDVAKATAENARRLFAFDTKNTGIL